MSVFGKRKKRNIYEDNNRTEVHIKYMYTDVRRS